MSRAFAAKSLLLAAPSASAGAAPLPASAGASEPEPCRRCHVPWQRYKGPPSLDLPERVIRMSFIFLKWGRWALWVLRLHAVG